MNESSPQSPPIPMWMLLVFIVLLVYNVVTGSVIPMWTRVFLGLLGVALAVESLRHRST